MEEHIDNEQELKTNADETQAHYITNKRSLKKINCCLALIKSALFMT
jgi:hypothetical protein